MALASISRRRFAGAALASLPFMTDLMRAGAERMSAQNDSAGHLEIAVAVNGHGPFRFVVDTGADRSVLADSVAEELGLPRANAVMLAGIVRTVRADAVVVNTLACGRRQYHDLTLPVLPRALLQADGYLGLDILEDQRVILDFAAHELTVADPLPLLASVYHAPNLAVVHAQGNSGHLRFASCAVDRIPVAGFIDTGAESSMGNEALFRTLEDHRGGYASHERVALTGLTGGVASGRLIYPQAVSLGRFTLSDCPIAIADLQVFDIWGLAERPALVIGMNWLRHFKRVEIDYGRKDLRFELGRYGPIYAA